MEKTHIASRGGGGAKQLNVFPPLHGSRVTFRRLRAGDTAKAERSWLAQALQIGVRYS